MYDMVTLDNPIKSITKHFELAELSSSLLVKYIKSNS